jgi:hypothetical protein
MSAATMTSISRVKARGGVFNAIGLELRKLRHSRFWLMAVGLMMVMFAWTWLIVRKRFSYADPALRSVNMIINDCCMFVPLFGAIAAALLSSRSAVLETSERMDMKWDSLGFGLLPRYFAKLAVVTLAVLVEFIPPMFVFPLYGASKGMPVDGNWLVLSAQCTLLTLLTLISVCAVQLMLATVLDRQAIGLGVGVILGLGGTFFTLGSKIGNPIGFLLPSSILAGGAPFRIVSNVHGNAVVQLANNPWPGIAMAFAASMVWVAIGAVIVKVKENRK